MSAIFVLLCLNSLVWANSLFLSNPQTFVFVENNLTRNLFRLLNTWKNNSIKNSSDTWQKKKQLSAQDFQNTQNTEPTVDSVLYEVVNRNHEEGPRQYVDKTALDDEKARHEGFTKTNPSDNPYAVMIVVGVRNTAGGGVVCSGSLLTPRWVLTAAQCFNVEILGVLVYAGGNSVSEENPEECQNQEAVIYVKHPRYGEKDQELMFDVAVVKVESDFKMTGTVGTIQLTNTPWKYVGYKECSLTGFGVNSLLTRGPEYYHRKTNYLEVTNSSECLDFKDAMFNKLKEDSGFCRGDTGGGLVCDGKVVAVAMLYFDIDTDECEIGQAAECRTNHTISSFTDVYPYLDWINSKVNGKQKITSSISGVRGDYVVVLVAMTINYQRWASYNVKAKLN